MTARKGKPNATGRSSGKIGGRQGRMMRPPPGSPWVWLTAELITSDAWRSLDVNARRFLDAVLVENMSHAGQENGNLKSTHRQLIAFGIHPRNVAAAIRAVEAAGLVDCHRGGMRSPTTFALTWLPLHDGTPPSNRWQSYRKVSRVSASTVGTQGGHPEKQKSASPIGRQTATTVGRQKSTGGEIADDKKSQKPADFKGASILDVATNLPPPLVGPSISRKGSADGPNDPPRAGHCSQTREPCREKSLPAGFEDLVTRISGWGAEATPIVAALRTIGRRPLEALCRASLSHQLTDADLGRALRSLAAPDARARLPEPP
jgi:hypothetical protein